MNGYQPIKYCGNCVRFEACNGSRPKRLACIQYLERESSPPNSGSSVQTPKYTPPPKQHTVWSVRDFAILYELASKKLLDIEVRIATMGADREEIKHDPYYQDLLRICEKLGGLNIEIETPSVEVEE